MFIYSVIIVLFSDRMNGCNEGGTNMKKNWQVLTSLIAAMFILSLFAGSAMAQKPDKYEKAEEKYQQRIEKAQQKLDDARDKFKAAKLKARSAKNKPTRDELKNNTVEYLEKSIDYLITHLEAQKSKVAESGSILPFDAAANLDAHIAQLEDIRAGITLANSSDDYVKFAREIEEVAIKARLETRYYAGILINYRTELFLANADNVSARLDAQIQELKDRGVDTAALEKKAQAFNALVEEARENYLETLELFESHSGFDSSGMVTNVKDARAFLDKATDLQKDTLKKLKLAARHLQDVFKDVKKNSRKKAVVEGMGRLVASGNGRAVIEGDVNVTLSGNATLKVSSNANVTMSGNGSREVLGNGEVKYQGYDSITIEGRNIRIEVSGNDISLEAEGTGKAVLRGNGTYRTERDFTASGEWEKEE